MDVNLLSPRTPGSWQKKRIFIVAGLLAVLAGTAVGAWQFITRNPALLDRLSPQKDLFEGFERLVLTGAHAQDNFELTAVSSDSLGIDPATVFILKSKDEVTTDKLKASIVLEPAVKFSLEKKADREWKLALAEPLLPNALVKVALAAEVEGSAGEKAVRDYEWAFQVKDTFKVIHTIPRDAATGVPLNIGIEVTFSHDNFTQEEQFVTITPQAKGKFERHGRTLVFVPEALQPGTIYTVMVKKGMPLTGSAETLAQEHSFAFETQTDSINLSPNAPWLRMYQKLQEVSTTEPPLVQLSSRNIPGNALDVAVYPLRDEQEYLDILAQRDRLPWWAYAKDSFNIDTAGRTTSATFRAQINDEGSVQYIRFPERLPQGFFAAELKSGDLRAQVWLQVTDVAAYVNVAKNETVVWVVNLADKRPVPGARVELVGAGKSFTANADGVARFATPVELLSATEDVQQSERPYFRVSFSSRALIIPATYLSRNYGYWQDSAAQQYWKYLSTDRPLYQPTDTIKFWGLLKRRDGGRVGEQMKLTLAKEGYVDYYYRPVVIEEQTLTLDSLGTFTGEIAVNDLRADSYSLQLKVGDEVIEYKYLQIRPYDKPPYELSLIPDVKAAFAGDGITVRAQASFFEGTPVPDLPLNFKTPEEMKEVTTDAEGKAVLAYDRAYYPCDKDYNCWPHYGWLSLTPELSEIAEIEANASVRIYGPAIYSVNKVSYPEKGRARIEITTRAIDMAKAAEGYAWQEEGLGTEPARGMRVEGEVIKIIYTRTETGTRYDFINKTTYKTYSYSTREETVDHFTGTTDGKGVFVYERSVEPETSYRVKYKFFDARGRFDVNTAYFYYYNGAHLSRYGGSDYEFYQLQLPEDNRFSVGERVAVDFVKNEESLPEGGSNYYLFLQYQDGLQEFAMGQNSAYAFPFEARDIPNVNLTGVYFNGASFITSESYWSGNSILFDQRDKELTLSVTPDKPSYRPGEQVNLTVEARDAQGSPVPAAVNLNLIDEAFYAVMDETASPLSSVYAGLWSGSMYAANSHRLPITPYGGAEKGGCFLAGTQILMEDGSTKPIEEIAVGDRVRTLFDPRSRTTEGGAVAEIYQHVISEYLVINGTLRVTPEHLVYANMHFLPAGELKVGDWMLKRNGAREYITTIEAKRAVVPVYNFRVEPQHTYFADGYYVHNEKGGGPREFFTDAALFSTVTTNAQGSASTRFTLPDNITSWRVTAQGVSARLDVGVSVSKIPVSLPVFLEVTVGKEFVAGDEPHARLRSYGTTLGRTDAVQLSLISPLLGISTPQTKDSTAFTPEFFPLPKLTPGTYDVTYTLQSVKGNDSVKLPLTALVSRLEVQAADTKEATDGMVIAAQGGRPTAVVITDRQRGMLAQVLRQLSWSWGDRIDQALARTRSTQLINEVFGEARIVPLFAASRYQMQGGGLTLLPYSSEDLELSARVTALRPQGFDDLSLTQYFFRTLEDARSNREEVTLSLYGLASLQQPVLPRLHAWAAREDLSVKERLYAALAAVSLGDGEAGRTAYRAILTQYAQVKAPHVIIKAGNTTDEILTNTALAAVLATQLNEPEQYGLQDYLRYNHPQEILLSLEELSYAQASLRTLPQEQQRMELEVEGVKVTADLTAPRFTYSLELQPGKSVTVLTSSPSLVVTTSTSVPLKESGLPRDPAVSIRREYYVNGNKTTTLKEGDIVEVRLTPAIKGDALDGEYQITDVLPSGLLPITKLYRGGQYDCNYWYPYDREAQKVKYMINKYWTMNYCGGSFIKYYAQVKMKGTYRAEAAVIQSVLNPDFLNVSDEEMVQIE